MKYKIAMIIPYFGKLPSNFQLWVDSCKYNQTIDFILFTDDRTKYNYPSNIKVNYMNFKEFVKIIQSNYDFRISINNPYKLCDFKPIYGFVLKQYIMEYDFWGYCDIDLILGNIRKFITDDILDKYDKILSRGHFTLFRNKDSINTIYSKDINKKYKTVFTDYKNYSFDEWSEGGINHIFQQNNIDIYDEIVFADLYWGTYDFKLAQLMNNKNEKNKKYNMFKYNEGKLLRYFIENNTVKYEEVMYVHFQKRHIKNQLTGVSNKYLIVPNKIIDCKYEINIESIKKIVKHRWFYLTYFKIRAKNILRKLKRCRYEDITN